MKTNTTALIFLSLFFALASGARAQTLETYTYDSAGRLTAAAYDGTRTIAYTYDANGNLLERSVTQQQSAGTGTVSCVIQPAEAVSDGARWRPVGTPDWLPSGVTQAVPAGLDQAIEFLDINGWQTPSPISFQFEDGAHTNLAATYTEHIIPPTEITLTGPAFGVINEDLIFTALILPSDVTTPVSYHWTPTPHSGGDTQAIFRFETSGDYTITLTASNSAGSATASAGISITDEPVAWGQLLGLITPDGANTDGARWRLSTRFDTDWHPSGTTRTLPVGIYYVDYLPLTGWTAPDTHTVTITEDTTNTTTAAYTCHLSVSPSTFTLSPLSSTGTVQITLGTGCPWDAFVTTGDEWLAITSATNGTGSATLTFEAQENLPEEPARTGSLLIQTQTGSQTITILQRAAAAGTLDWLILLFE